MPPLHPAIIHFPIALFPLAVIDELLGYLFIERKSGLFLQQFHNEHHE